MIDPVKFRKILLQLIKVLVIIELLGAVNDGATNQGWGRLGVDLILAGVLYVMWERITVAIGEKRTEFKQKMERMPDQIGVFDALAFSLLWSDAIYENVPKDRLRLVVISYTLITLGVVAAYVKIGPGLMPLVVAGTLVLGAVNLVTWVVSLEREQKESLQTELRLAHDVQMALVPKADPTLAGFDIAGLTVPAEDVGGDLFDYTPMANGSARLGISVVDVSGKGMEAAMSAVFVSGALTAESRQADSPAAVLTRLNGSVARRSRRGQFIAFLFAELDPVGKCVSFSNAGQTKPLLRTAGGVQWLDGNGIRFPLGMKEDSTYEDRDVPLLAGDILVLLTDGFTEAMNPSLEVFGDERIQSLLERPETGTFGAREIVDQIVGAVRLHASGAPQHDDMTIVVIKAL
jgi:serine phosphatase RsbU (regulator of sigma subunit)